MKFAGDVSDVGGEVAQDGAEAGGQEAGAGEDGHLSPVIRHQGHFSIFNFPIFGDVVEILLSVEVTENPPRV